MGRNPRWDFIKGRAGVARMGYDEYMDKWTAQDGLEWKVKGFFGIKFHGWSGWMDGILEMDGWAAWVFYKRLAFFSF